jgi:hypothetical protein
MQSSALALAFVAATIAGASAQQASVTIVEHGIYTADVTSTERLPNGVGLNTVTNICHVATTTTVPAIPGLHFGFRYRIEGQPQGRVITLRKDVTYPASVKPPGALRQIAGYDHTIASAVGEVSFAGYGFDYGWELMPGTWTFRLLEGDRTLAEQRFRVIDGAGQAVPRTGNGDCFRLSTL